MKAVLVIDEMPTECIECSFSHVHADDEYEATHCILMGRKNANGANTRAKWCPLKPLPRKLDANDWHRMFGGTFSEREAKGYGWNACLEEIEK